MTLQKNIPEVNKKIEDLIQNDFGSITSTLTNRLGPEAFSEVDGIVADSYDQAKIKWSSGTLPSNPRDIIWQFVTDNTSELFCNKILNHGPNSQTGANIVNNEYPNKNEINLNKINMLFACSNPRFDLHVNSSLILKILCGFPTSDIARILSRSESVVLKDINGTKKKIIDEKIPFAIPGKYVLPERLNYLQGVLKHIFDLGFNNPDERIKCSPELCLRTINLCRVLTTNPKTNVPKTRALMAYVLFCGSRLGSLMDENKDILKLQEQDREKWDSEMIKEGIEFLYTSASGKNVDKFHLLAGIEAIHSTSPDYNNTNWDQIVALYRNYLLVESCPETELEMAIAISKSDGPEAGLKAINNIKDIKVIEDSSLLCMTVGNLNLKMHKYNDALSSFQKAIELSERPAERTYLNSKIHICRQRIKMTKRYKDSLSF